MPWRGPQFSIRIENLSLEYHRLAMRRSKANAYPQWSLRNDNLSFGRRPLAVAPLMASSCRAPIRSRPPMPTPLQLSDEEMDLLLARAAPIDQRLRPEFLAAVAAELEAASAQTGVGPGLGVLHRVERVVQRKYWDPPQLPNASKAARA
jgi:hypothetical protein